MRAFTFEVTSASLPREASEEAPAICTSLVTSRTFSTRRTASSTRLRRSEKDGVHHFAQAVDHEQVDFLHAHRARVPDVDVEVAGPHHAAELAAVAAGEGDDVHALFLRRARGLDHVPRVSGSGDGEQ